MTVKVTLEFADAEQAAAFLQGMVAGTPATTKLAKAAKAKATESAAPAPAASPAAATAPAAVAAATPESPPTYPAFDTLKKAVLALAGLNRDAAVKILAGFKVVNASELKPEQFQAVIDAMEEKKAALDAAAAQASLV